MAQVSAEKVEHTGPAEKKKVATERAVGKYTKKNRVLDRAGGESQGGREKEESEREHGQQRMDSTVKEGRFQEGEGKQARRRRRKHKQVSWRKSSPGGYGESWFHSKSGQT